MYAIHYNAGNDRNGNPRRFTNVYDVAGEWLAAVDEGYAGIRGSLERAGFNPGILLATNVPTTASYRRECLRESPHRSREVA